MLFTLATRTKRFWQMRLRVLDASKGTMCFTLPEQMSMAKAQKISGMNLAIAHIVATYLERPLKLTLSGDRNVACITATLPYDPSYKLIGVAFGYTFVRIGDDQLSGDIDMTLFAYPEPATPKSFSASLLTIAKERYPDHNGHGSGSVRV